MVNLVKALYIIRIRKSSVGRIMDEVWRAGSVESRAVLDITAIGHAIDHCS